MLESNYFPTDDTMLELLCKQYEKLEDGLVFGKAGLAIYYARLSNEDPAYKIMYNRLTDDLLSKVSGKTPIELTRGLLGIALALDFIMCYFKPGNPDIVLDDVDAVIYKNLDKGRDMKPLDLPLAVEGLFYLSMHLKYGIRCSSKRRIYCRKAINLLNDICLAMPIDFFQEPIPFNMFNRSAFLCNYSAPPSMMRVPTALIFHKLDFRLIPNQC